MKNITIQVFGILMISLLLQACREVETKEDTKILQQLPFAVYTDSIEMDPQNSTYFLSRASLLSKQGFHQLAGADYKQAWELAPTETNALEWGASLENQGKQKEAVEFWKERKKQFPSYKEFSRRLSKLLATTGAVLEARKELDNLIRKDSTDYITWFELGQMQLQQADTNNARKSFERSYVIEPSTATGIALATLYLNKGDARILALCDQILEGPEPAVDALLLKGMYYSDQNQFELARKAFDACIKADYTLVDAHLEKGISYFREKNYTQALQSFETGLQVSKTNADCYFWIGRCFENQKNTPKARDNFERALSLDPELLEAKEHLKNLPE